MRQHSPMGVLLDRVLPVGYVPPDGALHRASVRDIPAGSPGRSLRPGRGCPVHDGSIDRRCQGRDPLAFIRSVLGSFVPRLGQGRS